MKKSDSFATSFWLPAIANHKKPLRMSCEEVWLCSRVPTGRDNSIRYQLEFDKDGDAKMLGGEEETGGEENNTKRKHDQSKQYRGPNGEGHGVNKQCRSAYARTFGGHGWSYLKKCGEEKIQGRFNCRRGDSFRLRLRGPRLSSPTGGDILEDEDGGGRDDASRSGARSHTHYAPRNPNR